MSDYTPIEDFSVKDGLTTGDPDKLILGADLDAELAAIQTAVATKYDSGDLASQAQAEAGSANTVLSTPLRVKQAIDALAGGLVDMQTFIASGTWTKPSNARFVLVEAIGCGGGGGGVAASIWGTGGGGGGGGQIMGLIAASDLSATESVTIGSAGTAGANTGGNGGSGGDCYFSSGATQVLWQGGAGGTGVAVTGVGAGGTGPGGTVGGSVTEVFQMVGGKGDQGFYTDSPATLVVCPAGGGGGYYQGGASATTSTRTFGDNSYSAYGCGGGGAGNANTGTGQVGGTGVIGMVRVWTYA